MGESRYNINPLDRQFIRLLTDFGFKRVFGSKEHASILLRFLNALFENEMKITKIEFHDKEILPEHLMGKKIYYDIYCTTDTGHHFIVEMQQEESENFPDRMLFYVSRALVQQGLKGIEYRFCPVYCIVLMNFHLSEMSPSMVKDVMLMERNSHEIYSDKERIILISLKDVPEEWDECKTELLRMLYLIKNMENLNDKSKPYLSGEYEDIFQASSTGLLTNEEAVAYSQSYLKELDNQSAIKFAAKKNLEEGERKGREEGERKGRKEGRLEGAKEILRGLARKFRSQGMGVPEIAQLLDSDTKLIESLL